MSMPGGAGALSGAADAAALWPPDRLDRRPRASGLVRVALYVVIVQDVRGSGDSGGDFALLADDAADGAETLAWAADHPAL